MARRGARVHRYLLLEFRSLELEILDEVPPDCASVYRRRGLRAGPLEGYDNVFGKWVAERVGLYA